MNEQRCDKIEEKIATAYRPRSDNPMQCTEESWKELKEKEREKRRRRSRTNVYISQTYGELDAYDIVQTLKGKQKIKIDGEESQKDKYNGIYIYINIVS